MEQIELIQPLFLHPSIDRKCMLKRFNSGGRRYYFDVEAEEVTLYPSVTSIIADEFPKEQWLIDWMLANPNWKDIRDSKAEYGTAMHHLIADAIVKQEFNYNFNYLADKLKDLNLKYAQDYWVYDLQKDLAAFAKFVCEYEVKPIASEIALINKTHKFAGAIDLIAEITIKGQSYLTIIDFKSNHNGNHGDSNAYQLLMYKMMWEENYPELPIEKMFNWMPKDYRTEKPTYHFIDLTDKAEMNILLSYLFINQQKDKQPPNKIIVTGRHKFGESAPSVRVLAMKDFIKLFF